MTTTELLPQRVNQLTLIILNDFVVACGNCYKPVTPSWHLWQCHTSYIASLYPLGLTCCGRLWRMTLEMKTGSADLQLVSYFYFLFYL